VKTKQPEMSQEQAQILYNEIKSQIKEYTDRLPNSNQLPKMREQAAALKKLWPKIEEVDDGK